MSEIKVTQMPEAQNINDNDLLMIVQGGYNKKIPKALLGIPTKAHQINVGEDTDYRVNLLKTKNLFDGNLELGTYDNTTGIKTNDSGQFRNAHAISVMPNTIYTASINGTKQREVIYFYDKNMNFISYSGADTGTFTTPNNCYYINFRCYVADFVSNFSSLKIQLEEGSTATEYTPFINNQINVDNEKYSDTINVGATEDSRSRVNVLKSKNLLDFNNISSYSSTNVTATPSYTDGKLNYINVTKSASQSSNEFITLKDFIFEYPTGDYILSGCPSGGGNSSYALYLQNATAGTDVSPRDIGEGAEVALTKGIRYKLYLRMASTAVFSDKKFYPMLRKATDTNDSYEPYIVPTIKVDNEEIYNSNLMNYSTSEQRIGTWIDGKPLYRKVVFSTNLAVNTNNDISISNTYNIKRISGYNLGGGSNFVSDINAIFGTDTTNHRATCFYISTSNVIRSYCGSFLTSNNKYDTYITIEYTKTTD